MDKTQSYVSNQCPRCGRALILLRRSEEGAATFECFCGWADDPSLGWLEHPGLLFLIQEAITAPHSVNHLIGEDDNVVQLLLTILAGQSVEVRGQTSSGKNSLVDHVLSVFPRNEWVKVGGLTDKALRYLDESVTILYITERRGMQSGKLNEETTAEYDVKLAISEGEVSVAVTQWDTEAKKFATQFRSISIQVFIFTTTEISAPSELENRISVLNVRDDTAQNILVRDLQLDDAARPPWDLKDPAPDRIIASRALERVRREAPKHVVVPFARALVPILSTESSVVRRNTPRILNLVKACARLHYRQRPVFHGPNGEIATIATPTDLALVLYTGERSLRDVLSRVPAKAAIVLQIIKEVLVPAKLPITTENIKLNAGSRKSEIGAIRTVQASVRILRERGVLIEVNQEGHAKVYEFQGEADTFINIDVPSILAEATAQYDGWCRIHPTVAFGVSPTEADNGAGGRIASQDAADLRSAVTPEAGLSAQQTGWS